MENIDTKKKIIGLLSTIVVGIFIAIALYFTILSLTMNLQLAIQEYFASASEASLEETYQGEMILVYFYIAGIGVLAILIVHYFVILVPFVISVSCVYSVIKNVRFSDNKVIKIINFVYLGLLGVIVTICTVKFILYVACIG